MSKDGTEIAYERTGRGPPLVLVYGNGDAHQFWNEGGVRDALAEHHTVYVMERRGRGRSGDAAAYELAREAEDVAAVADAIGEPVTLLGHSGGALYALEAATRTRNLRKLILYEPPIQVGGHKLDIGKQIADMQTLVASGDHERALVSFQRDIAGIPPEEIDALRASPAWQNMVQTAPTLPRELDAIHKYAFDAGRFKDVTVPTLLLTGSESPPFYQDATRALHEALPESHIVPLEGQQHMAMQTAPDTFIDEVLAFTRA